MYNSVLASIYAVLYDPHLDEVALPLTFMLGNTAFKRIGHIVTLGDSLTKMSLESLPNEVLLQIFKDPYPAQEHRANSEVTDALTVAQLFLMEIAS